jgi:hypothetical protein
MICDNHKKNKQYTSQAEENALWCYVSGIYNNHCTLVCSLSWDKWYTSIFTVWEQRDTFWIFIAIFFDLTRQSADWARWRRQLTGDEIRILPRKMASVVSLIQRDAVAPLTFGSANVWRKDGGRKWAETRTEEMRLHNRYSSRGNAGSLKTIPPRI